MTSSSPRRSPTIGAIGLLGWDTVLEVDRYPPLGGYAVVSATLSTAGGTTLNSVTAARRLGAEVMVTGLVGDDAAGRGVRALLEELGVDTSDIAVHPSLTTDASTVIVDRPTGERSILWDQGARIAKGNRVPIDRLFSNDVVIIDTDDLPLRRFLTDLPAHTRPGARLIGPLTYLAAVGAADAVEIALRHDVVVGNEREFTELVGVEHSERAMAKLRSLLRGSNARLIVMTHGPHGATAATIDEVISTPGYAVACRDTTGAGDAFVGGLAYGLARRWPLERSLRLANAVAALTTTALGSRAGHPSLDEARALARIDPDGSDVG